MQGRAYIQEEKLTDDMAGFAAILSLDRRPSRSRSFSQRLSTARISRKRAVSLCVSGPTATPPLDTQDQRRRLPALNLTVSKESQIFWKDGFSKYPLASSPRRSGLSKSSEDNIIGASFGFGIEEIVIYNKQRSYSVPSTATTLPCRARAASLSVIPDTRRVAATGPVYQTARIEKNLLRQDRLTEESRSMSISRANASHTSLADLGREEASRAGANSNANANANGTARNMSASAGPTNLSGLVCNVHRTTGKEPHALVGATTTILGDKLYVFGGRMLSRNRPRLTSDLYELDLIRRHWTKVETSGDIPPPRYFHSVCALGDTKLVCYGGMSASPAPASQSVTSSSTSQGGSSESQAEIVVMSDIHVYDVLSRKWTHIDVSDPPQGRYAHCATILPSSAVFTSANAPTSAIHHNPPSSNPHQGSIGVAIDGTGGAEMVVVGGQDGSNHYIGQISIFNLRNLKWTTTESLARSCGAYRSVVTPLTGMKVSEIGSGLRGGEGVDATPIPEPSSPGTSTLIYSNYNFLDVKLELQIRLPNGTLTEKPMQTQVSPPGLRFPNGGVIDGHFVVSGTYLTSSKQEYALWALDLKNLTWGRIDAGGAVFGHGSWNRGIIWNRRNTFVVLGHRKRSLVEDYNHRRINFSHICMVELEAFGLYDNPRRSSPSSGYVSVSSPAIPASLQPKLAQLTAGGRPYSPAAEQLGAMALSLREMADMDLLALGGERIPVNSHIMARRWGPYFNQLLKESAMAVSDGMSDAATLRPPTASTSRNSAVTITPSIGGASIYSNAATIRPDTMQSQISGGSGAKNALGMMSNLEPPNAATLSPASRPRSLYLPHTASTLNLLVHYLYTSSLPPTTSPLCSPHVLCSVLQLARPYQIDGLLEATVERLHEVLDGRNAAAVFNATAMAAGGGRGTGFLSGTGGTLQALNGANAAIDENEATGAITTRDRSASNAPRPPTNLRINTNLHDQDPDDSLDSASTTTSASTSTSVSAHGGSGINAEQASTDGFFGFNDLDGAEGADSGADGNAAGKKREKNERGVWTGDVSSVIGLQKRGLRGLMEGRRMRERGPQQDVNGTAAGQVRNGSLGAVGVAVSGSST